MKKGNSNIYLFCFIIIVFSCSKRNEVDPEVVPKVIADFESASNLINQNEQILFTDLTEGSPTAWNWTFEGGSPSSSSDKNPIVTFADAGIYSVNLSVSNKKYSDEIIKSGFIIVLPTSGLKAFYPFSGNAEDKSTYSNDGFVSGATLTTDRNNKENSAYLFNGSSDFINTNTTFDFENRSLSLWINPANINGINPENHIAISQDDNNLLHGILRVEINDKNLKLWGGGLNGTYETPEIEVNKWYHLVLIRDKAKTYYYINATLVHNGEAEATGSTYNPNKEFIIGSGRSTENQFFAGKIDDIRLYDKVLTLNEIKALFRE